jgi:hypothetical protein
MVSGESSCTTPAACLIVQYSAARQLGFKFLIALLFFIRKKKEERCGLDRLIINSSAVTGFWPKWYALPSKLAAEKGTVMHTKTVFSNPF